MAKKRIAITGGIGSGKSTVLALLREMHYAVFSCDEIYADLIKSKTYIEKIQAEFPYAVKNGEIDKHSLAETVFNNPQNRKTLNEIAHPLIMQTLFEKMNEQNGIAFAEVPLLFEGNYQSQFDGVIVVMRERQARIRAITARDNISKSQAEQRLNAQFDYDSPLSQKVFLETHAFLLNNNATQAQLKENLFKIIQTLSL